jgi:hypothetical protein
VFCTVCCLSKSYAHKNNCKEKINFCEKKRKKKEKKTEKKNTIARSRD